MHEIGLPVKVWVSSNDATLVSVTSNTSACHIHMKFPTADLAGMVCVCFM